MKRVAIALAVLGLTMALVPSTRAAAAAPTAPSPPTSVSAAPAVAGAIVSWAPPSSDGGSPLTGFIVTPSVGNPLTVGPELSETVIDAPPGAPITVTVAATNAVGSSQAVTTAPVTPNAPGGLTRAIAPQRLVDSRFGIGVAQAKLAPSAERVIQVTGKAGIPSSGVASVFVNVMALDVDANTSLRVYPEGSTAPGTSSLDAIKAERVIQLVEVRLGTGGRLRVRNGGGATNLVLDVVGYSLTPAASGASSTGLVTATAPKEVLNTRTGVGAPKVRLGAGRSVDVTVLGTGGVPATGVAAVFVNLTAYNPSMITGLTVYPAGPLPGTQNLSAVPQVNRTNRVLVPVSAGGKVRITNQYGTVDVKLDLAGWVSDGSDASLVADSLNTQSPARLVDTRRGTGATKAPLAKGAEITVTAAGAAGVPKITSTMPATAVLAFVRIYTSATTSSVSLRPAGSPWASVADVTGRSTQTMGNLVLVPLSADGKLTIRSSPGSSAALDVVVDVVGWVGGSILVTPQTRVLDAATLAAITNVSPSSITFSTASGSAATLQKGDVVAADASVKTPTGLLRRVTSVTPGSGSVTIATTSATLSDAVRRGGFKVGATPSAPAAPALSAAPSGVRAIGGSTAVTLAYDKTFDVTLASAGDASVTLAGGFHASASASLAVEIGAGTSRVDFDVAAAESLDATLTASFQGDWTKTIDLGSKSFGTKRTQIGAIPVFYEPIVRLSVEAIAQVEATATVGVTQSFGASAGVTLTPAGATTRHEINDGPATASGPSFTASATARVTAIPEVALKFYGSAEAALQVRPYLRLDATVCEATASAGLDVGYRLSLAILGRELGEYAPDPVNLQEDEVATVSLPACAPQIGPGSLPPATQCEPYSTPVQLAFGDGSVFAGYTTWGVDPTASNLLVDFASPGDGHATLMLPAPTRIAPGTYTVKVGVFYSAWSPTPAGYATKVWSLTIKPRSPLLDENCDLINP